MTILVQSFLNSATKLSTTATTATTVAQLKTLVNAAEGVSTSIMEFYIKNDATTATVLVSGTLGSYGITTATVIYSSNIISTATNKADRQLAKLELAQLRRQAGGDTSATFYRSHNTYDITQLPTTYRTGDNDTNNVVDNPNVGIFTLTPGVIQPGIRKVTYSGYHNDNVAFTNTATATASTTANNFTIASIAENTTVLYTGYLLATYTGDWTFTLTSDDSSYLWIGANAVSGYTNVNQNVFANYNTVGTVTVSMTAGEYYPIRLLYGNGPETGNLALTYAHTGQAATSDFTGKLFSAGVQLIQGRPWATVEVYTGLTFTYGEATISFTLAGGIFYNVTVASGAGGYPYGEGVVPVITMPGNQLTGGTTPANDIQWEYTVDTPGGAITSFTYRSGTPP
jgi:hypothetical protein